MRDLSTLHRRSTLASVLVAAPLSLVLLGSTALAAPGPGHDTRDGRASSSAADPSSGAHAAQAEPDPREDAPAPARPAAPARSQAQEGKHEEAPRLQQTPSRADRRDDSPAPGRADRRDDSPPPARADRSEAGGGRPAGPTTPAPLSNADANGGGADPGTAAGCGAYCSTRDGSASQNGNGGGTATGKPCAGCVGRADNKDPQGQRPGGNDRNNGYECDGNGGIGKGNPAHTGCSPAQTVPPKDRDDAGTPGKPDGSCSKGRCSTTPDAPVTPGTTVTQLPAAPTGGGAVPTPGLVPTAPVVRVPTNGPVPVSHPATPGVPSLGPVVPGSAPTACPSGPSGPSVNGMVAGCPVTTVTVAGPLAGPDRGVVLRPRAAGTGALVETVPYDASAALPRTGGDTGALLGLSALLVLGGGTLVAAGRPRRSRA